MIVILCSIFLCLGYLIAPHLKKEEIITKYIDPGDKDQYWYTEWRNSESKLLAANLIIERYNKGVSTLARTEHTVLLGEKIRKLRREITLMREKAELHNKLLFATGLIVNCTGCDRGGPDNYENLTEERVQEVEHIARRLRSWFNTHRSRKLRKK